jgi:hypothetical protein
MRLAQTSTGSSRKDWIVYTTYIRKTHVTKLKPHPLRWEGSDVHVRLRCSVLPPSRSTTQRNHKELPTVCCLATNTKSETGEEMPSWNSLSCFLHSFFLFCSCCSLVSLWHSQHRISSWTFSYQTNYIISCRNVTIIKTSVIYLHSHYTYALTKQFHVNNLCSQPGELGR